MVIRSVHLFCRVVDNFGDIGVCWRLSRQLQGEHGTAVTLWVDDLRSFQRLCPAVDPARERQQVEGIAIRHWRAEFGDLFQEPLPDLVIEAFACELPDAYVRAMAQAARKPAWINLEYLSAEAWVEGCHALPSPHPSLPLTKHFFFPGFSAATGGLLCEAGLLERRKAFQADGAARIAFLSSLGVDADVTQAATRVSLFCYPSAPVSELFDAWETSSQPVLCLVPEGVAAVQVQRFLQQVPQAGVSVRRRQLTVQVIPFLSQPDYDRLLWSCDLNLVRGEDSLVRAVWAGQPFIWQIYQQEQNAHWPKLEAFLHQYRQALPAEVASILEAAWRKWNGENGATAGWEALRKCLPPLSAHTRSWALQLQNNGDLASNLLRFAGEIG